MSSNAGIEDVAVGNCGGVPASSDGSRCRNTITSSCPVTSSASLEAFLCCRAGGTAQNRGDTASSINVPDVPRADAAYPFQSYQGRVGPPMATGGLGSLTAAAALTGGESGVGNPYNDYDEYVLLVAQAQARARRAYAAYAEAEAELAYRKAALAARGGRRCSGVDRLLDAARNAVDGVREVTGSFYDPMSQRFQENRRTNFNSGVTQSVSSVPLRDRADEVISTSLLKAATEAVGASASASASARDSPSTAPSSPPLQETDFEEENMENTVGQVNGLARQTGKTLSETQQPVQHQAKRKRGRPSKKGKRAGRKKPRDMPKRPLSGYNIYFREERAKILDSIKSPRGQEGGDMEDKVFPRVEVVTDAQDRRSLRCSRPHRKIGFQELGKMIGKHWQELSSDRKQHYQHLADLDTKRYKDEMAAWEMAQRSGFVQGDNRTAEEWKAVEKQMKAINELKPEKSEGESGYGHALDDEYERRNDTTTKKHGSDRIGRHDSCTSLASKESISDRSSSSDLLD